MSEGPDRDLRALTLTPRDTLGIPNRRALARPFKSEPSRTLRKIRTLIEIYWGKPISLAVSPQGAVKTFSTIKQVHYWLREKWPVSDTAQIRAIDRVEAAMECLGTVGEARSAFLAAATTAGFSPCDTLDHPIAA